MRTCGGQAPCASASACARSAPWRCSWCCRHRMGSWTHQRKANWSGGCVHKSPPLPSRRDDLDPVSAESAGLSTNGRACSVPPHFPLPPFSPSPTLLSGIGARAGRKSSRWTKVFRRKNKWLGDSINGHPSSRPSSRRCLVNSCEKQETSRQLHGRSEQMSTSYPPDLKNGSEGKNEKRSKSCCGVSDLY